MKSIEEIDSTLFEKKIPAKYTKRKICPQNDNHKIDDSSKIPLSKSQHILLERILDSLTHPFYVIDTDTYEITLANRSAEDSFQKNGTTCFSRTHGRTSPCHSSDLQCPLEKVLSTGEPVRVEHIHCDETGTPRYMEVHGYPIRDETGRITQMIEYNLDVTERKNAKKALEAANQRAMLYLDILGHDISNQLQIISTSIELLQSFFTSGTSPENLAYLIDIISESTLICKRLISEVNTP